MRFLYYDSVTQIEKGRRIVGVKTFSLSEEFLRGHYKKIPLVPGVILIEAMAQLDESADGIEPDLAVGVHEPIVADFHESCGQNMLQEAADKFHDIEGHGSQP